MADALQFRFDIGGGGHVTVGEMTEVQFHARLEAPVERHFVDGDRALAVIHGGREVPRRIEMCGAMRGQPHPLEAPAFAVGQIFLLEAGKEFQDVGRGRFMIEIFDRRPVAGRIGGDVVLKRNGNVDHYARHAVLRCSSVSLRFAGGPGPSIRFNMT